MKYLVCLFFWLLASAALWGQVRLEVAAPDCKTLKAFLPSTIAKIPGISAVWTILLEKELQNGLWQKIQSVESILPQRQFQQLSSGKYRVRMLSSSMHSIPHFATFQPEGTIGSRPALISNTVQIHETIHCRGLSTKELNNAIPTIQKTQIFPNPFTSVLNIHLPEQAADTYVSILSPLGQLKAQHLLSDPSSTIDLSAFPPGLYLIHLQLHSGLSISQKIIKAH